jgi:hypothetical protein
MLYPNYYPTNPDIQIKELPTIFQRLEGDCGVLREDLIETPPAWLTGKETSDYVQIL